VWFEGGSCRGTGICHSHVRARIDGPDLYTISTVQKDLRRVEEEGRRYLTERLILCICYVYNCTYSSRYFRSTCFYRLGYESCSVEHLAPPQLTLAHAGIGSICHCRNDRRDANDCTSSDLYASYALQVTQQRPDRVVVAAHRVSVLLCCNKHISSFCSSLCWVQ
jgi:hypothetical protein